MGKILLPNTYVQDIEYPLIFLAGPIRGAPDWHSDAIKFLFSQKGDLFVASPRRVIASSLSGHVAEGNNSYFSRQRAWERHYISAASRNGVILFWLPREAEHKCRKPYASMTRVELGQVSTHYKFDNSVRFVIGTEGEFQDLDAIGYDLSLDAPGKKVKVQTLEETCLDALKLLN
jgi:hypothetical protein